jgi:hypothetical protein
MKRLKLIACSVMMMSVLMVSCSLNDGTSCPEALTGELTLIESEFVGTWVLTNMVSEEEVDLTDDNVENPSTEIFQQLSDCQKDLVFDFGNDRAYTIKQGYSATNCENKQSLDGTWKLIEGKLTLVALCTTQLVDIEFNGDNTIFTREDIYTFQDIYGFTINTNVTSTYEKTL